MSATDTLPAASSTRLLGSVSSSPAPPARPSGGKHIVHWFRKGLRLHDNPALRAGLADANTFRCVFIIDPWFASSSNVGINKWRFLLQCLEDLDSSLRKLNSRLFVVRGQPADALPKLFREWGTTELTFEEDPEPYGRVRDHNIMSKCREVGITVISRVSHTLYKLDKIIERNGGKAPLTYHQFQALVASMPPPPPAEPPICAQTLGGATTPVAHDHDDRFGVPTLEELGFETESLRAPVWIGGESEALTRLERHLERKAWVASFGRPKMTPQSLLASQTGLSPYLRFGCLSTRLFYYQLTELYKRIKRVRPPLSLHGQILWREFFYCAATRNPNFDRMEGNPICVQIPWEKNQDALAKWASGRTGFPWIDAIMIQLREEGWIHHLARHAVACFLTRGDLWISWEEGMKVFDELLLDADWSVNAGMWMWLSCSSFFQQFFHCYCPVRFGRKTDPNGDFIRRYIPALKNMPTRYIHEPWMAPESVQQSARCTVGRDYPLPMVDHHKTSQVNLERIKQVYAQLAKYKPQEALSTSQPQGSTERLGSSPSRSELRKLVLAVAIVLLSMVDHHKTSQVNLERIKQVYAQLAKYKPQAILNPQNLQRPNVMQSSPSPTTIIANINQSNYLCSQSPDPQTANTQNFKDNDEFQHPGNHRREGKTTLFKQVVIVQAPPRSPRPPHSPQPPPSPRPDDRPRPPRNYIMNLPFKMDTGRDQSKPNYNFKSLAINNYIQGYSNTGKFPNQQLSEMYQRDGKGNFGFLKPKFYMTCADSDVQHDRSRSGTPQNEFDQETKTEPNTDKSDDSVPMNTEDPYEISAEKPKKHSGFDANNKNQE